MIIALFPNLFKSQSKSIAIGICEFLTNQGVTVVVEDSEAEDVGAPPLSSVESDKIDFIISLGGDGTILRLVQKSLTIDAPILGVNLGSLGFMADIPVTEVYPSLQDLVEGRYQIQNRIMMQARSINNEKFIAVNEVAIHRSKNPTLVDLAIHVDGNYLNTFSADGIIIATPSGSTAYSLAAGGPILTPDLTAFVITPISPHTISNRPIVLMPKQEIQIQYISEYEPIEVSFDGFHGFSLSTGEMFHISLSSRKFRLVNIGHHDYYSTLRTKLGWAGTLRK